MTNQFCRVLISALDEAEANKISEALVSKRLVAGALITDGTAKYWWNGKVVDKHYFTISAFTLTRRKEQVIAEVKSLSSDQTPTIAFFDMDGSEDFLQWIKHAVQ